MKDALIAAILGFIVGIILGFWLMSVGIKQSEKENISSGIFIYEGKAYSVKVGDRLWLRTDCYE